MKQRNNASNSITFNFISCVSFHITPYSVSFFLSFSLSRSIYVRHCIMMGVRAYTFIMCVCASVCFRWHSRREGGWLSEQASGIPCGICLIFIWHIQMINDIRVFIISKSRIYISLFQYLLWSRFESIYFWFILVYNSN